MSIKLYAAPNKGTTILYWFRSPEKVLLDLRQRGRGFEPHGRHYVVFLSKNINPSLVLVQPRKTRPYITERLLMGRKESNQTNKSKESVETCKLYNSRIFSKLLEGFSSIFHGKFNFQGLFKTNLYIQVLFKPVRTLEGSDTLLHNQGHITGSKFVCSISPESLDRC